MRILLFLPILAYVLLVLVNLGIASELQTVNLFGFATIDMPIYLFNAVFIVAYTILIFFIYDGMNALLRYKIRKMDREMVELKSDLYDNQESLLAKIKKDSEILWEKSKKENTELLKTIDEKNKQTIEEVKKENLASIDKRQKEAEKILARLNLLDDGVFEKIKRIAK